jgi:hypothetical protein
VTGVRTRGVVVVGGGGGHMAVLVRAEDTPSSSHAHKAIYCSVAE